MSWILALVAFSRIFDRVASLGTSSTMMTSPAFRTAVLMLCSAMISRVRSPENRYVEAVVLLAFEGGNCLTSALPERLVRWVVRQVKRRMQARDR